MLIENKYFFVKFNFIQAYTDFTELEGKEYND